MFQPAVGRRRSHCERWPIASRDGRGAAHTRQGSHCIFSTTSAKKPAAQSWQALMLVADAK
jgi:hypothetical protein